MQTFRSTVDGEDDPRVVLCLGAAAPALAQQRPLVTEDPETVGAGNILLEGGFDCSRTSPIRRPGSRGDLLRVAHARRQLRLQLDPRTADRRRPLQPPEHRPSRARRRCRRRSTSPASGRRRSRTSSSRPRSGWSPRRPAVRALGVRLATKLPTASNESGLGLDTHGLLHDRAGRQDGPIGADRRQLRRRHSLGPGRRRSDPNHVAAVRRLVRASAAAGARVRRRDQRPLEHARRRSAARHGIAIWIARRHAIHARHSPRRRRVAVRLDVAGSELRVYRRA